MSEAIWMPLFDDLADPGIVADLAARAEAASWDGFFVWDHIRWQDAGRRVGDAWVTLAAIARSTDSIRIGPMVVPLPRYRPAALVRQTISLDHLSKGRLIVGAGLGDDRFGGEYSRFGEDPLAGPLGNRRWRRGQGTARCGDHHSDRAPLPFHGASAT